MLHIHRFFILIGIAFIVFLVFSTDFKAPQKNVAFEKWLAKASKELSSYGIQNTIISEFRTHVKFNEKLAAKHENKNKKDLSVSQKVSLLTSDSSVLSAQLFFQSYKDILEEKSKNYNIPSDLIVAIFSITETQNNNFEKAPLVDILATLAFLNQDNPKYIKELKNLLLLVQNKSVKMDVIGNQDGTFGMVGVLPSTYMAYNASSGTKKYDIVNSVEDAMDVMFNILVKNRWDSSESWGSTVSFKTNINYSSFQGADKARNISDWEALGVIKGNGSKLSPSAYKASLLMIDDYNGVLLYSNFDILFNMEDDLVKSLSIGILSDKVYEYQNMVSYVKENVKPNPKPVLKSHGAKEKIDDKPISKKYKDLEYIK
jgi:membrane-bound lytic murein transglycosylase B